MMPSLILLSVDLTFIMPFLIMSHVVNMGLIYTVYLNRTCTFLSAVTEFLKAPG